MYFIVILEMTQRGVQYHFRVVRTTLCTPHNEMVSYHYIQTIQ